MDNKEIKKEFIISFYFNNKINVAVSVTLSVMLAGLRVFVGILLQQILGIASTGLMDNFIKLLIMSIIFITVLAIIYFLHNIFFPKYIHKALKQYKSKAFSKVFDKDIESFNKVGASQFINQLLMISMKLNLNT